MRTRRLVLSLAIGALSVPLSAALPGTAQGTGITFIGFDDVPAECYFVDAGPLRGRYAAAKFKGPTPTEGGAALDACSSFPTPPRTGDRFLAFSANVPYEDGTYPVGPETITLPIRQKTVAIWVSQQGSGSATFKLVGKRAGRSVTSTTATTMTSDWLQLKIHSKKGFDAVVLNAPVVPGGAWTADDLTMSN